MSEIGVRDLKTYASEVVRRVMEQREHYIVTHRGRPAAIISPIDDALAGAGDVGTNAWQELTRLGQEISHDWDEPRSSTDLLSEMRR